MAQKRRLPTGKGTLPSMLLQGYITRPAGDRQPLGSFRKGVQDKLIPTMPTLAWTKYPQRGPEAYKEGNKEG